eukprot:CAMPEP_0184503660 /NCGR_PEP_ID=MMETSP0113_2-20130426/52025_1 /TAXON_ID=91329 /ORGANISM="Norrisiella sphaerica, Strain BC52" /LENGTH=168 /DNA_ID=CAMNT_0026893201 /DNA_START=972 /DNA_END=1478 /DNA_ORIENTATION=+
MCIPLQLRFATIQDTKKTDSNHVRRNLWKAAPGNRATWRRLNRAKATRDGFQKNQRQSQGRRSRLNPLKRAYLSGSESDLELVHRQRRSIRRNRDSSSSVVDNEMSGKDTRQSSLSSSPSTDSCEDYQESHGRGCDASSVEKSTNAHSTRQIEVETKPADSTVAIQEL